MKPLKITLIVALFFASMTSCTRQDLSADDIQEYPVDKTDITHAVGNTQHK